MKNKRNIISIIIPCYNEEKNIIDILLKVNQVKLNNIKKEIIVIDDCSKDSTLKILKKNKKLYNILITHDKNKGKGASIKSALKKASGDFIIIQDADLEYNPNEYKILLDYLINNNCDVVYGTRFKEKKYNQGYLANRLANYFLTFLFNFRTKSKLTDINTCYKLFKKEVLKDLDLKENRFGLDPEITLKITKKNIKIEEVPITYKPRSKKEGKKINIKDGILAIYCLFKYY